MLTCKCLVSHYKTGEIVSVDTHKGEVDDIHLTSRFYRAHLQEALVKQVDPAKLHLKKAFESVTFVEEKQKLVLTFEDGTQTTADIVLGADGIHSRVRTFFVPTTKTAWTGWVVFRSVFSMSHLSHIPDVPEEAEHIWGPDRHIFLSRLGRDLFTVVGSHQSDPGALDAEYRDAKWDAPADVGILREFYKDWHPRYRAIVDATPHTKLYPNSSAQALNTWILGDGRITVAGDAAHAHGGSFAAGGSLALDDAWAFSAAIQDVFPANGDRISNPSGDDIAKALRLYEKTRKPHTDKVMAIVHQLNEKRLELLQLGITQTDEDLRARMKNRYDPSWVHEHDVQRAFAQARIEKRLEETVCNE